MSGAPGRLLAALKQGEDRAFRQVAEEELGGLYVLAHGILGSSADAEDVCQEVLLRLHRAAPRLAPDTSLRAWLRRVCVNCCLDELRRRKRNVPPDPLTDLADVEAPDPYRAAEETELRLAVRSALVQLPPNQRAVFVLRHFHGCSVRETAHIVGCAEGTIKAQLSRAVRGLRARLSDWDPATGEVNPNEQM